MSTGADNRNGATRALAQHAATLTFDALPPALVSMLKQCVLDTLGVAIGASGVNDEAKLVHEYVRDLGGREEATIWGFGDKAPAPWAAAVVATSGVGLGDFMATVAAIGNSGASAAARVTRRGVNR